MYVIRHIFTGCYLSHIDKHDLPIWNCYLNKALVDKYDKLVAMVESCDRMVFDYCEIVEV